MKNILILGSSGFIGRSLVEHFCNNYGNRIKKLTLIQRKKFHQNINHKTKIQISCIRNNLYNMKSLPNCDALIYCIKSNNSDEALKLFDHFKNLISKKKKCKILFLSSGAIYGPNNKKIKLNENIKISLDKIELYKDYKLNYAKQKFILESKFSELSKNGYKISIARCFAFYGEHILDRSFYISKFIKLIKQKKKNYKINNLSHIFRSYMYSYDMCEWLYTILNKTGNKLEIYNVGSDETINLNVLSLRIAKKFKKKIKFKINPKDKITDYYIPSVEKIKKMLKVKTRFDLKKIIEGII